MQHPIFKFAKLLVIHIFLALEMSNIQLTHQMNTS